MSKRFLWLLGLLSLIGIGFLVACSTTYHASSDGLLVVGSQGSNVLETFVVDLGSGHIDPISNSPNDTSGLTCLIAGQPTFIVIDPAGQYAYAIIQSTTNCTGSQTTGIASFPLNSDGTLGTMSSVTADPNPQWLTMDSSGKFLFVAEGTNSLSTSPNNPTPCPGSSATNPQYGICTYAISAGAITAVQNNITFAGGFGFANPEIVALAATPTVLPALNSACETSNGVSNPTTEYLYAADQVNGVVWEFNVDTSTGALSIPNGPAYFPNTSAPTAQPAGVAVDACNRFVYVSNMTANNISAYSICNGSTTSIGCPQTNGQPVSNGQLIAVPGSPFSLTGSANYPRQMLSDPYGNNLYVLEPGSNTISTFKISAANGKLTPGSPATVATGLQPTSMALRGDDSWLFVANYAAATISQYSVTPQTGALTGAPPIFVDNYPYGVAVK